MAFTTHFGVYEFVMMPSGLCNSPCHVSEAHGVCLGRTDTRDLHMYLDDFLVMGTTFEGHLKNL